LLRFARNDNMCGRWVCGLNKIVKWRDTRGKIDGKKIRKSNKERKHWYDVISGMEAEWHISVACSFIMI